MQNKRTLVELFKKGSGKRINVTTWLSGSDVDLYLLHPCHKGSTEKKNTLFPSSTQVLINISSITERGGPF